MELRKFGRTVRSVSTLGLGGGYLSAVSRKEGVRIVRTALESGISYFDVAPSYKNGLNESIVAEGLGDRIKEVFVATKVLARSYEKAKRELEGSLERLGKVDLVQLHSVDTPEALDLVLSGKGAIKAVEELKDQGVIKYIGITNHFDPKVLEEAISRFPFDSVMMPLGIINAVANSFEHLLDRLNRQGVATIGILVFGNEKMEPMAEKALRYSLSLPASVIIVGASSIDELKKDIQIAQESKTLSEKELDELKTFVLDLLKTETPWWLRGHVGIRD